MASPVLVGAVLCILPFYVGTHSGRARPRHAHLKHAHPGHAHPGHAHPRHAHPRHAHPQQGGGRKPHHSGRPGDHYFDYSTDHHYAAGYEYGYWDYGPDYDSPTSAEYYHLSHGPCDGGTTLTGPAGVVTSPRTPDAVYPPNAHCWWRLEAPAGRWIQLRASVFSIERSTACAYDHLQVFDGRDDSAPSLAKLCGKDFPEGGINSTGGALFLRFESDASVSKRGFRLLYTTWAHRGVEAAAVPAPSSPAPTSPAPSSPAGDTHTSCGGNLTAVTGSFTSPAFGPNQTYPDSTSCEWTIHAPQDHVVKVDFEKFDVEYSANCQFDSLSVYDGPNQSAPLVDAFCGSRRPASVRSSGRRLVVVFRADSSVQRAGFLAKYSTETAPQDQLSEAGCHSAARPAVLRGKEGVVKSPSRGSKGHYPDNTICQWRVHVAEGKRAHLHFTSFSVEPDGACRYDHLEVFDGGDTDSPSLGRYCGDHLPGDLTASSNLLLIHFRSDESVTAGGFGAVYSAKAALGGSNAANGSGEPACGIPRFQPKFARIVGGMEAVPYSWPWQVSVQYFGHHYCGGTVLAARWVLTAAHCLTADGVLKDAVDLAVRVGEHNQQVFEGREQTVPVAEVIVHPAYDQRRTRNDIALLRLQRALRYGRAVLPACLPRRDAPTDLMCVATGWGLTQGTANPRRLNQVRVPIIDRALCRRPDWYYRKFTDNMLCAGYPEGGKDSCQGDSGGPLVCRENGVYRLQGVTSWGFGCARPRAPGIYTRVTRFIDWIDSQTNGSYQLPP